MQLRNEILNLNSIFRKLFFILRLLGATPLQFNGIKFQYSWKSYISIYSLLIQTLYVLGASFSIFHIIHGNVNVAKLIRLGPTLLLQYTSTNDVLHLPLGNKIVTVCTVQFYFLGTSIILTTFPTVSKLEKLLNKWMEYIPNFSLTFPNMSNHLFPSFSKFHQTVTSLLKLYVVYSASTTIVYFYMLSKCIFNSALCSSTEVKVSVITCILGPQMGFLIFIKNLMILILAKIPIYAFAQVSERILEKTYNFKSVFNLIIFIRKQYKLTETFCSPLQLITTGFCFTLIITNWIVILWLLKGHIPVAVATGMLSFVGGFFVSYWILSDMYASFLNLEREIRGKILAIGKTKLLSVHEQVEVNIQIFRDKLRVSTCQF